MTTYLALEQSIKSQIVLSPSISLQLALLRFSVSCSAKSRTLSCGRVTLLGFSSYLSFFDNGFGCLYLFLGLYSGEGLSITGRNVAASRLGRRSTGASRSLGGKLMLDRPISTKSPSSPRIFANSETIRRPTPMGHAAANKRK